MWKVIILSAFLIVCQAANISDIYGTFTAVVIYPNESIPICIRGTLSEDPRKIQCTCSDGTQSTLVEVKLLERLASLKFTQIPPPTSVPMLVVDKLDEQMLVGNVTCDCGVKAYDYRSVIQVVNENYLLSFVRNGPDSPSIHKLDYLLARNLPTTAELEADIRSIDELKVKSGQVVCTKEIYEELRLKN